MSTIENNDAAATIQNDFSFRFFDFDKIKKTTTTLKFTTQFSTMFTIEFFGKSNPCEGNKFQKEKKKQQNYRHQTNNGKRHFGKINQHNK